MFRNRNLAIMTGNGRKLSYQENTTIYDGFVKFLNSNPVITAIYMTDPRLQSDYIGTGLHVPFRDLKVVDVPT